MKSSYDDADCLPPGNQIQNISARWGWPQLYKTYHFETCNNVGEGPDPDELAMLGIDPSDSII